jgi:hypothetical protein
MFVHKGLSDSGYSVPRIVTWFSGAAAGSVGREPVADSAYSVTPSPRAGMTTVRSQHLSEEAWWISVNQASFEEAEKDARANGDEIIHVPYFPISLSGGEAISDLESHFPMVDWEKLREYLQEAEVPKDLLWFASVAPSERPGDRPNKPDLRCCLDWTGKELSVKVERSMRTMRFIAHVPATGTDSD